MSGATAREQGAVARRERVVALLEAAHARLVQGFEELDGTARFGTASWERPGGGGGRARVLEGGAVFERAGVNFSAVHGASVPPSLAATHPGTEGLPFFATGLSMVLHASNPYVPAFHANFRYFEAGRESEDRGLWWFGGGADMTPAYPFHEDAVHFHATLRDLCARHPDVADYPRWKAVCDDYFTVRHRNEMRGVGGIFFDEITPPGTGSFDDELAFVEDGLASLMPAYGPIVRRRAGTPYGERERSWQLLRRGRYVEFNLVYDRGTLFGLQTRGNIEAILMSMPPLAGWAFDRRPEPGSAEAEALAYFQPRDWVGSGERSRGSRGAAPGTAAPAEGGDGPGALPRKDG